MKKFTKLASFCLALSFFLSSLPTHLNAQVQNVAKLVVLGNGDTIPFLEYTPAGHNAPGNTRKYPLIVFLHGGGEKSDNTSLASGAPVWDIEGFGPSQLVSRGNPMAFTWNGQMDTCIVLSPMCRATVRTGPSAGNEVGEWPASYVTRILNYARDNLKIDTNRIYLTGMSFGGAGTFHFISVAAGNPKRLAAAAPVCAFQGSPGNPSFKTNGPQYVGEANLPVWGFHARNDGVTDDTLGTINPINSINNRVPAPQVKALMTIWATGGHSIWPRVYDIDAYPYGYDGIVNIYEWFLGQNKSLPVNALPDANAGNDFNAAANPGTATLNGSGSIDSDGGIVRYVWKKITAPAGASPVITNSLSANSSTSVSGLTTVGNYTFRLYTVDTRAAIDSDDVVITVVDSVVNQPPVANAGADQTITLPVDSIRLLGSHSDADGTVTAIKWEFISGPSTPLIYPNDIALHPIMKNLEEGDYLFRLKVTDDDGAIDYDTVLVTVNSDNLPPVANAGADQTITLPVDSIRLFGSHSDADGTVTAIKWEFISGPSTPLIYPNDIALHPIMKNLEEGVYQFRFKVTDNDGAVDYDTVLVTVNPVPNIPPVANAGPDKTITLPVDSIRLLGSHSDADGTVTAIKWEFISGPSTPLIYPNDIALHPIMKNLEAGVYLFRFKVTDNDGAVDYDTVQVTVGSNAVLAEFPDEVTGETQLNVSVNPNPVRDMLNVTLNSSETGRTTIGIYDANGSLRKSEHTQKTTKVFRRSINISRLSSGVYYVHVIVNGKRHVAKFVRQ